MDGEFEKDLKKAAHRYAMLTVKQPFTHKEAVKDVEETFIQGALVSKRDNDEFIHNQRAFKKPEELANEALPKFYQEYYGTNDLNPTLIEASEEYFYEGMNWEIKYCFKHKL